MTTTDRPARSELLEHLSDIHGDGWQHIDPELAADAILGDEPIDWISDDTIAGADSVAAWVARAILTPGPWWVLDVYAAADDLATQIARADLPAGTRLAPSDGGDGWGIGWWSADGTESGGIGAPIGSRDDTIAVLTDIARQFGAEIGDDNTVTLPA